MHYSNDLNGVECCCHSTNDLNNQWKVKSVREVSLNPFSKSLASQSLSFPTVQSKVSSTSSIVVSFSITRHSNDCDVRRQRDSKIELFVSKTKKREDDSQRRRVMEKEEKTSMTMKGMTRKRWTRKKTEWEKSKDCKLPEKNFFSIEEKGTCLVSC